MYVFCVDCQVIVDIKLFSTNHKKHEMKIPTDLLDDMKKELSEFLEDTNQETNMYSIAFDAIFKKFERVQQQANEMKNDLNDQCKRTIHEIENKNSKALAQIDEHLLKIEYRFKEFKAQFVYEKVEKIKNFEKLFASNDEEISKNINLLFGDDEPLLNIKLDLGLKFTAAFHSMRDFFSNFKMIERLQMKEFNEKNEELYASKASSVSMILDANSSQALSSLSSSSNSIVNMDPTETQNLNQEIILDLVTVLQPYTFTQDKHYYYVLYSRSKMLHLYWKQDKKFALQLDTKFEPCHMVASKKKIYYIDNRKKDIFSLEDGKENVFFKLTHHPNSLKVDSNGNLLISTKNNLISINLSTREYTVIPMSSGIGNILKYWTLKSCDYFLLIRKNKIRLFKYDQNSHQIQQREIGENLAPHCCFVDVSNEGRVALLMKNKNFIEIFDENLVYVSKIKIIIKKFEATKNIYFKGICVISQLVYKQPNKFIIREYHMPPN